VAVSVLAPQRSPPPGPSQSSPSPGSGTLEWLDALKGIAILAVVSDHAFIVYAYLIWKHLYFAVSWFIFLAGVSNTFSARRRRFELKRDTPAFWRRRAESLLPPYLGASAFAFVTVYAGRAPLAVFLRELAGFHTLPPLYFIPLLLQFLLVFPILFTLLYRSGWMGKLLVAALTVPVAAVLADRITFGWPLGAHYLLGASFLYLFLLGMALEPLLTSGRIAPFPLLLGSLAVFAWAERMNINTGGLLMTHPPSNLLVVYAVSLLGVGYTLCRRFPGFPVVRAAAWLGRRSLQIFLYHYPFLLPLFAYRQSAWTNRLPLHWSQAMLMAAAIPIAIAGSLLVAHGLAALAALPRRLLHRTDSAVTVQPLYTVADRK
jgi:peptidoglycan/LPS O-acetylase OafA/YrhL